MYIIAVVCVYNCMHVHSPHVGSALYMHGSMGDKLSDVCPHNLQGVPAPMQYTTDHSGFLCHILCGDIILADRGFLIEESLGARGASLCIPAFTKGKVQLAADEIERTRNIANVRIHVE